MKEKNKETINKTENLSKKLKRELAYTTQKGREVQEFVYEYKNETEEPENRDELLKEDEER